LPSALDSEPASVPEKLLLPYVGGDGNPGLFIELDACKSSFVPYMILARLRLTIVLSSLPSGSFVPSLHFAPAAVEDIGRAAESGEMDTCPAEQVQLRPSD
jgi:hypothetical protein